MKEKRLPGAPPWKDLQEAYAEINDRRPSVRTIYRLIRRLNPFFDPRCYGETPDPGEEPGGAGEPVTGEKVICSRRCGSKTYYIFRRVKSDQPGGAHDATMLLLGMYPQLRGR